MADYDAALQIAIDGLNTRPQLPITVNGIAGDVPPDTFTGRRTPDTLPFGGDPESTLDFFDQGFAHVDFGCDEDPATGQFWFEQLWAIPSRIELGSIISTVIRDIEIYNSFRGDSKSWTSATANAGPGVDLLGVPTLPSTLLPQTGEIFQVRATTDGPPSIDGTLDFIVSTVDLVIFITGQRVILFAFEPELPIEEQLEWLTDIMRSADGSEQRVSLRKNPRQMIRYAYKLGENDTDRQRLRNTLFGAQAAIWGIPIWFEKQRLTAAASVTDTVLNVSSTNYADFRNGGLAVLWASPTEFDALEIQSFTATTITFTSGIQSSYPVGSLVMPMRLARTTSEVPGQRWIKNLDELRFSFTVTDNDSDLADTSAFDTHNSKVMLDDPNWIDGASLEDSHATELIVIDNKISAKRQTTLWTAPQLPTNKGFFARSRQQIWETRELVHALRGSQVSFYMPSFFADVELLNPLGSGSDEMSIENVGFDEFTGGRTPFGAVWVLLNDGSTLTREIIGTSQISAAEERITVDSVWTSTVQLSEIDRVSILRLSRIAGDRVTFTHFQPGRADIKMNVIGVQQ